MIPSRDLHGTDAPRSKKPPYSNNSVSSPVFPDRCKRVLCNRPRTTTSFAAFANASASLFFSLPLLLFFLVFSHGTASASIQNNLFRVEIRPKSDFTRLSLKFENPVSYSLEELPENRLRLLIKGCDGPFLRKLRSYSDRNMGGVLISRRGDDLLATFRVADGVGWRDLSRSDVSAITLDIGRQFQQPEPLRPLPGRDKIRGGIEKLVWDFDPPLKAEIPFAPTDRQILMNILDNRDMETFSAGEAALYKGRLSEAEEIFALFAGKQTPARSIAYFRLGETYYKLQKYPQALACFREGEKIWPAFLQFNPGVLFYYGDSVARAGDLAAARTMLSELISKVADKQFAPALLVRLADILTRQGHGKEALGIYRNVAGNFTQTKANRMARLRLDDLDFLKVTSSNYRPLSASYFQLYQLSGDIDLREESFFKHILLESLYGDTGEALRSIAMFQSKFPLGSYAAVAKTIREELVSLFYRETDWKLDKGALLRLVEEQRDYLSGCFKFEEFIPAVADAYSEAGRPIELVSMFARLLDNPAAVSAAPFMYEKIIDNALLLGDDAAAEKYSRLYLKKFPDSKGSRFTLERLGGIYFIQRKYPQARETLYWLLNRGERAINPESYYYLANSLREMKQHSEAARAFRLFLSSPGGKFTRFLPDAYYACAASQEAAGDRKGALRTLEEGIKSTAFETKDALLYKSGEIALLEGDKAAARNFFDMIIKKSHDQDWRRLAGQALESFDVAKNGR